MNDRILVVVLGRADDEGLSSLTVRLPPGVEVVFADNADALATAAVEADVIFYATGGRSLLEAVFVQAPRVRWVHSRPTGVDTLLFPALVDSPVPLTNSRGAFSRALAEFVIGAVLFFAKDVPRLRRQQASGVWQPFEPGLVVGSTLGVVGFGDIGRATARLARAIGMRVLALRRQSLEPDADADEVLGPERLHELLERSDAVALCAPLTPQTRGLIGRREIAALRETAILINVGRGPVLDEAALREALRAGKLRGAALDVFEQEPLPAGHPFYRLDNVLLSPHCADRVAGWLGRALDFFLENLGRFQRGEALQNLVDKHRGY